ncbi:MAG: hypothetical protein AB4041_18455 [Microcystaceae cyanobacterium]
MQQTSLNLIAIAIFAMTLSALLSPVFNISPFVPATATFGILGLITIDTLSLENKGINLILDLFASSEQRQRVIHHEAGHFLAAYYLGIPITDYTLTAWESIRKQKQGQGGVEFNSESILNQSKDLQQFPLILERIGIVLMAGIAAEKELYADTEGGTDDRQQLRQILSTAGVRNEEFAQKESWSLLQAKNLISRHQAAYNALVEAMKQRLSVEDCYKILGQYE